MSERQGGTTGCKSRKFLHPLWNIKWFFFNDVFIKAELKIWVLLKERKHAEKCPISLHSCYSRIIKKHFHLRGQRSKWNLKKSGSANKGVSSAAATLTVRTKFWWLRKKQRELKEMTISKSVKDWYFPSNEKKKNIHLEVDNFFCFTDLILFQILILCLTLKKFGLDYSDTNLIPLASNDVTGTRTWTHSGCFHSGLVWSILSAFSDRVQPKLQVWTVPWDRGPHG